MKPLRLLSLGAAVVVLAWFGWQWQHSAKAPTSSRPRAVSVAVAETKAADLPVWLSGLGNVAANQSITIRPRVSGELQSVAFEEGQPVQKGQVLAQIDPRPYQAALDQALAQQAQDEAKLANDRREFDRIRGLVATNTESKQQLDQRAGTLAQSAAAAKASQAMVDNARLQLEFTTVRAPIDGVTGVRLVDAGNLVTASQTNGLVVLTQTRPIAVVFTVPQSTLPAIRRGQARDGQALPVEALSETGEVLARGQLQLVDNQIDLSTGTLRLKALFPNDDLALWPGQFVNARVLVETLNQALVVPAEAIQPGLKGPFVYRVKSDSTVEVRQVKPGPTVQGVTVVTAGLALGDRVVRDGQNKLQPGARVEIVKNAGETDAVLGSANDGRPGTAATP
ncbi:MAG: efflux RND transporter periplasmic adaptor subunit [Verrucomicrobia bacterium]|nr:efflux RND transporter periplasmic adaptor subunit [Verrucomicrobiota bacterium]